MGLSPSLEVTADRAYTSLVLVRRIIVLGLLFFPLRAMARAPLDDNSTPAKDANATPVQDANATLVQDANATLVQDGNATLVQDANATPTHVAIADGNATSMPADDAASSAPSEPPRPPSFIKGDLAYPGTRRLLSRYSHVGVSVGVEVIDADYFATVAPGAAFYMDNGVAWSVHAPVRLLLFQGGTFEFGGAKIRSEDWDEVADYARIIRFVTYGRKESNLYYTINTMRPATIGHGMLLDRYQGDIDIDRSLTGLVLDAYNDYGGFQLQANDITFSNRVMGGLAFVKPLTFVTDDPYWHTLSLGVEYMGDVGAPRCVQLDADTATCVQGSGHQAGFSPYTGESLDQTYVRSDPDTGRFAVANDAVHALGVSSEFKIYRDEHNIDVKLYATWHKFLNDGGGDGLGLGSLARINLGSDWRSAFRLRGELRSFSDGFVPSYFDTLYEVQKYAYNYNQTDYQVTPTKYQAVFGDAENGFPRLEYGRRMGYRLDADWGLFTDGRTKEIAASFGLQDSARPNSMTFHAHLESPFIGFIQVFGTFMRVNVSGYDRLFTSTMFSNGSTVILSGLRFQILPILFLNASYSRGFRVVRSPGSEYHLGNETIVDFAGNANDVPQDRLFDNVQTLFVDVEFGWEFDDE